jgi:protein-disulfide isomerase
LSDGSQDLAGGRYRVTGKREASTRFELLDATDPGRPGLRVRLVVVPWSFDTQAASIIEQTRRYAMGAPGLAIATAHAIAASPPGLALAFELGTGVTLDEPIERSRVLAVIESAAATLALLHDQGIAHGLVHPALIGVDAGDRVILGGYGVAQLVRASPTLGDDRRALAELSRALLATAIGEIPPDSELARRIEAAADAKDLVEWGKALRAAVPVDPGPPPVDVPPAPTLPPAVEAPSPPAAPPPPVPNKPSDANRSWPIVLAVGVSFLLLFGVVAGLFAYGVLRARAAASSAAASAAPPAPVTAAPSAVAKPPPPSPAPPPEPAPEPRRVRREAPARSARERASGAASDAVAPVPVAPTTPVSTAGEALVTAVVFGDLECPHTRRLYRSLTELERLFGDDLRLAWRYRPLREHGYAQQAAQFAAAVHEQAGSAAFWRLVGDVSRSDEAANPAWLVSWAERQERAFPEFRRPHEAASSSARVQEDLALANRFDVRETPTVFVNGLRILGDRPFDELRGLIENELRASRALLGAGVTSNDLYATRVTKNLIGLGPEAVYRACPPLGRSPRRGATAPLVTLVMFADFECPFCRRTVPTLRLLESRFKNELTIVWKHLPLPQHPNAANAARLSLVARERAGDTGFWRAHDLLFAAAPELDAANLARIAEQVGLEANDLSAVIRGEHQAAIDADVALAKRLGVTGTPTFFVNGLRLGGALPPAAFESVIREEIEAARRLTGRGVPREKLYAALCSEP